MKTKAVVLAFLVAIGLGAVLQGGVAFANGGPPAATYLALGDSVALGDGASDPATTAYVPLFHEFLREDNPALQLVNLGTWGETSDSFIIDGQLDDALDTIADPDRDVQVVTLHLGGQDLVAPLLYCMYVVGPGEQCEAAFVAALGNFADNYEDILGELTAALAADAVPGNEVVYVQTAYNPFEGSPLEDLGAFGLLGFEQELPSGCGDVGLNDSIVCIGGDLLGATVVDDYPLVTGHIPVLTEMIEEGDANPNDLGHALLADALILGGGAADDNCPTAFNPDQQDANGDGYGDACLATDARLGAGVQLGWGAIIGHNVKILGRTVIGDGVVIHNQVILGPDAAIGMKGVIGEKSVVMRSASVGANATLGEEVVVAYDVVAGDSLTAGGGTAIERGATVGNDVALGENVRIGSSTVLGDRSTIGDHTWVSYTTVLGADVELGASVTIGGRSNIGDRVSIDDGTTAATWLVVGSDASIGSDCKIGWKVTIGEGVTVGDNVTLRSRTTIL